MKIFENPIYLSELSGICDKLLGKNGVFLVTGATGLIGSCVVDLLMYANQHCKSNFKVYALSRNFKKLESRFSYIKNKNWISYIAQDICDPLAKQYHYDYIIHAASNADPIMYSLFPAETLLTNIYGTKNVLDYCVSHKKTKVLLTSSFEVYGQIDNAGYYSEENSGITNINQIRSSYPESKRCAELLLRCYYQEYGIDGIIARLSSVYGPAMTENDSKAHAQFIRNAINNKNIVLKSAGTQKRTYTYIIDTIDALLTVLFYGVPGEAYNISNENSIATIAEVAQTIAEISETKVVFDSPEEIEKKGYSNPQDCILSNDKLRQLGWRGQYTLKDGLEHTIKILMEM